ncbi:MAG: glycoside hydrolase family 65 protein [Chitinophagales bacterium]
MKNYILHDEWQIIEKGFKPELNKISESLCSIGNGRMGQRANFEEKYSGETLQGSYVAGVYYPDKTRVGWWKNGYPEYFAKVLNACNWIGINVTIGKDELDLATCNVSHFKRVLDMQEGVLYRNFTAQLAKGQEVKIASQRFCSIADDEIGAIRYSITSVNFNGTLTLTPYLDGDVENEDANYGDKFWNEVAREVGSGEAYLNLETKKTFFHVATGMCFEVYKNGEKQNLAIAETDREKYVANTVNIEVKEGDEVVLYKYAANLSSMNYAKAKLIGACRKAVRRAAAKGFDQLLQDQKAAWAAKWEESDVTIEGDVSAQQGIRFNIFQMNQTYTGEDERLNIGPKGFTGEKYGGSTYWDTEAYCFPFYLSTADPKVARQLLVYRYKHLQKAIENGQKLGFTDGAALYPMVTMNGEECHNEWEITFEELHRNGAIAFAIYDYIRYTADEDYLAEYGLEVLMGIARFWSQRVNFSKAKNKYVMLGVTGPNEYENNVNNNWYTNYIACWCMGYCQSAVEFVKEKHPERYAEIAAKTKFDESEMVRWKDIRNNMYFPFSNELNIYLQQDNFLDKEIIHVDELSPADRPINQKWSWDRILRSCFIKQADTLQGMYLFEDHFDTDTIRRHFDFYEPLTVHESSLSPCVHVILAAKLGYKEKAYEMYLRTARLDLDDYNNDTEDGCHITSMAGTWMAVIKGFAGMRVKDGHLHFTPFVPDQWQSFAFKVRFRGHLLKVEVNKSGVTVENETGKELKVFVFGHEYEIGDRLTVEG